VLDGKYRLDEQLGAGGFGAVFRGRHLVLDAPIAIKVFRPAPGNDSAEGLQRFLREGATTARLDHPNAVRVLDSGVSTGGVAFLIMELLRGQSLAQELKAVGKVSLRRAAQIAATVADVLAAAHARGILHRDIKPDNVFLHREGDREVVKVVDFGIARFFDGPQSVGVTRLTQPGEYLGTPRFIAPERIACGPDDGRSDVFSLGAILYQSICGLSPWTMQQERQMPLGLVTNPRPRDMRQHRSDVPPELESLILRCLAWEPAKRPTAAELAAELTTMTEWLDDTPPTATPQTQREYGTILLAPADALPD
jgi:serine/threonine protein kinase